VPIRATTKDLRDELRILVNDPAGDGAVFTEQQLQDFLDQERATVTQSPLEVVELRVSGGAVRRRRWRAATGDWESGVSFANQEFDEVTPTAADLYGAIWDFDADADRVFITGNLHNVYGAAVECLRVLAANVAQDFDVGGIGVDAKLSQAQKGLLALIEQYREKSEAWKLRAARYDASRAETGFGRLVFDDIAPDGLWRTFSERRFDW
jgi:hypothetical protein